MSELIIVLAETTLIIQEQQTHTLSVAAQGPQGIQGVQGPQGVAGVNTWGSITGTLSNQTDLQSALDGKISKNGTTTTTANIPFALGALMSGNSALYFNQVNSGSAHEGRAYYDGTNLNFGMFNSSSAKLGNGKNIRVFAVGGASNATANGGSVFLWGGDSIGTLGGTYGFVGVGQSASPMSLTPASDGSSFVAGGESEFQGDVYLPNINGSILATDGGGRIYPASAGTEYEAPLTFNSPLSRSSNTISFLFNTNNTWTGTNKINTNSTAALFVEQDGVKDNVFIVDTTNAALAINQAIDTTSALAITENTKAYALRTLQTYATRTNAAAINASLTLDWTSGNGANVNGMVFVINDNHGATSGSANSIQGINTTITRSTSFLTTRTSDNLRSLYLQVADTGNYNAITTSTANSYGSLISQIFSPTTNPASGSPTLTYSGYGTDIAISGTPVVSAGSMVYNIYGLRVNMAVSGAAATKTGYGIYIGSVTGYDTNWAYYNATVVSNFMGIDNGKSYFGTGIDASLYYDGTDFIINPKEVGSGTLKILGHITLSAQNIITDTTTGMKIGTNSSQKIGFWNATPVVQQVLATGAGRTVDDVITFLQTIGLCKQS